MPKPAEPPAAADGPRRPPWPSRLELAGAQLRRGALDAPWPEASWGSVARRGLVTGGLVALGAVTGTLDFWIFAAFGALQLGLGEAALPLPRLVRLVVGSVVVMVGVAYVAALLGGTWWTVPFLAAVAFLQGSSTGVGLTQRAIGFSALAMGVIFAGLDTVHPGTAAAGLALGAVAQGTVWLLLWHRERDQSVRRALGNCVRTVARMAYRHDVSGRSSNLASAEVDRARATIRASGVPNREAATAVADAIDDVRRTAIAWRALQEPGYGARLAVLQRLRHSTGLLRDSPRRAARGGAVAGEWTVARALDRDIARLDRMIARYDRRDPAPGDPDGGREGGVVQRLREWPGLRRGTPEFRHGLRMALAIGVAQAVSLVLPVPHAFWIPLTCVFIVKPDWSFTVVRSAARLAGNLLAVLLVPLAVVVAAGQPLLLALLVAAVSAVAFRYFTGNYILGSFGIAGTVLILDEVVAPDPDLLVTRILSTLLGAAIGLAAAAAVPAWRGRSALPALARVTDGLAAWTDAVCRAVVDPAALVDRSVHRTGEEQRNNLLRVRPAVEAALLEPRPTADPRVLSVAVDAAERAHLALLALTFQARAWHAGGTPGLDLATDAAAAQREFAAAAGFLGGGPVPPWTAPPLTDVRPVRSDEDWAVALQMVRLHQAAADLAAASGWARPGTVPADEA